MDKQILAVLAVSAIGVVLAFILTANQLWQKKGDFSHQKRGLQILATLLIVLLILEGGLRGTSFKAEPVTFWLHMLFAIPTTLVLIGLIWSGLMSMAGSVRASIIHERFNAPDGIGLFLWLCMSLATGLLFTVVSITS